MNGHDGILIITINTFAASTVPYKVRLVLRQLFDFYPMVFSTDLATPTSNRFQILENNGEICNSDKSSHPEGNSAFQIELENVKL